MIFFLIFWLVIEITIINIAKSTNLSSDHANRSE